MIVDPLVPLIAYPLSEPQFFANVVLKVHLVVGLESEVVIILKLALAPSFEMDRVSTSDRTPTEQTDVLSPKSIPTYREQTVVSPIIPLATA